MAKYPTVMRVDVDSPAQAEVRLGPGLGRAPVLQLLFRYGTPSGGKGRHRETIALNFEPTCTERRAGTAHTFYVGGYEPDADGAIVERWTFTDPQPRVKKHAHGRQFESEMSTAVEGRVAVRVACMTIFDVAVNPFGAHDVLYLLVGKGESERRLLEFDAGTGALRTIAESSALGGGSSLQAWYAPSYGLAILASPLDFGVSDRLGTVTKAFDAFVRRDVDADGVIDERVTMRYDELRKTEGVTWDPFFKAPAR